MKTVRNLLYRDVLWSVFFVTIFFIALFFFIDFVDEMSRVGRNGYTMTAAALAVLLAQPGHVYELFPIADTLQLFRFVEIEGPQIRLTPDGKRYANADVDDRKQLFARHLLSYVPLAGHIRRVLDERRGHRAPARRFRDELEDYMSEDYADQTLKALVGWGRYGEAFAYDEASDLFSLEDAV